MSKTCFSSLMLMLLMVTLISVIRGQSGTRRRLQRQWGVNFTLALYQYDEAHSRQLNPEARLPQTFDSAAAEMKYLQTTFGLEDVMLRHVRSVGLLRGERFLEAAHLGDEDMTISIQAQAITPDSARLAVTIRSGATPLLEASDLHLRNYETVVLKGGRSRFGLKTFTGPEGPEHVPAVRTLLVTATAVIVRARHLRNRPRDLSHPTDEYGRQITLRQGDVFLPPVIIHRVTPRVPLRRGRRAIILLEGMVTPDGRVTNIRVLQTFDSAFNDMAIDAFKQYKILPARLNDKPVYATLREAVSFPSAQ